MNSPVLIIAGVIITLLIILTLTLLFLRRKKSVNPLSEPTLLNQNNTYESPTSPDQIPVSPTPAKTGEGKYLLFLVFASITAILIPLGALLLVKSSPSTTNQQVSSQTNISGYCQAVTLADTLGNPLSQSNLEELRIGDEIKILIGTRGSTFEKARYRVNGSQWQEVTQKDQDNFVGNYILEDLGGKYTVEAEVFDKEKGWL